MIGTTKKLKKHEYWCYISRLMSLEQFPLILYGHRRQTEGGFASFSTSHALASVATRGLDSSRQRDPVES